MPSYQRYPQRDGLFRIFPERVAVYDRHGDRVLMVDALGSEIWLRADGKTTLYEITLDISVISNRSLDPVLSLVDSMAVILSSEGVMYLSDTIIELPYHLRLAQEEQDIDLMRASMQQFGWLNGEVYNLPKESL